MSVDRDPIFFAWCGQLEPIVGFCCRQLDGDRITNYSNIGDAHCVTDYGSVKRNSTHLVSEYGDNTNDPRISMKV